MAEIKNTYTDLAIVLAWPHQTARGDEKWMSLLKKTGIVKNLNFKVGHAAIVLVERDTGNLDYFDFGRYITPRGHGRARCATTDHRLKLYTKAYLNEQGNIKNLRDILAELEAMEQATHGGGGLYLSIARNISYHKGKHLAQQVIARGVVSYGAIARKSNSCSRYVAQILLASLRRNQPSYWRVYIPECIKASPMSNVVNSATDRRIYFFHKGELSCQNTNRLQSLRFQLSLLAHNLHRKKSALLPDDQVVGMILEPIRPSNIPAHAQWLGGIGEGVWYSLKMVTTDHYLVTRFCYRGGIDYEIQCRADAYINLKQPYQFTYNSHYGFYTIKQGGNNILLTATVAINEKESKTAKIEI